MNRWIALAIALPVGAAIAYFGTMLLVGAIFSVLWLFVLGDHPWPTWIDPVTRPIIFVAVMGGWAYATWLIWRALTRRA